MSTLVEHAVAEPEVSTQFEASPARRCDCAHEELTDGLHHYLQLPSRAEKAGAQPVFNEKLSEKPEPYIAVAMTTPDLCFMAPSWIGFFRGDSELGEIAPATKLLCNWCKAHWSKAPHASFERL